MLVLENLRFYKEETLAEEGFAKQLADLADVYVNDAFGAAHRNHASTTTIASFFPSEKYFGLLLKNEVDSLEKALSSPQKPFTAIIGGGKDLGKNRCNNMFVRKSRQLNYRRWNGLYFCKSNGGENRGFFGRRG